MIKPAGQNAPLPEPLSQLAKAPEMSLASAQESAEELMCMAPEDNQSLAQMGSALQSVSLTAAAPAPPTSIRLLGLKQGDSLEVDGTTTADGTAKVKLLNPDALELEATINIPYVARGLADDEFALSGGKVKLSISVTREGDKFRYRLRDLNAGGKSKGSGLSELKITDGSRTESSLFGDSRKIKTQSLTIDTPEGPLSIKLELDGKEVTGSVSIPGLPSILNTFDLEKE